MSTERIALVCPGMGPLDRRGLLRYLLITPTGRRVLAEAEDAVGHRFADRWQDDTPPYDTAPQLCFLAASVALATDVLAGADEPAALLVGTSFGARTAAIVSGALGVGAGFALSARCAEVMADYFATEQPGIVTQSFARFDPAARHELITDLEAAGRVAELSCVVDQDFVMITVEEDGLDEVLARARAAGALPLFTMNPPMHAARFAPLRRRLQDDVFAGVEFDAPRLPVLSDTAATVATSGAAVAEIILQGCDHVVDWPRAVEALVSHGVSRLEVAGADSMFTRAPITDRHFTVRSHTTAGALRPRPVTLAAA